MKKGHFQRLAEAAAAFRSSATFLRKSLALKPNGKLRLHSPSDGWEERYAILEEAEVC